METTRSKSRAAELKGIGYPVEEWEVERQNQNRLKYLDGGRGPHHLSGDRGKKVRMLE